MNLNHVNLCSSDVKTLSDIFSRYFGFKVIESGDETGGEFAFMRGEDGFTLVIIAIKPDSPTAYPTNFHVGFTVETLEAVFAKHLELSEAGRKPGQIKTFEALDAQWTAFYCLVGNNMSIEVNFHT